MLYANVEIMPEYYADPGTCDIENFYRANRLIGALADVRFHECGRAVEDYQRRSAAWAKQIHDVDVCCSCAARGRGARRARPR
ncbi:MAG: hypothetical protein ACLU0O_08355 [Collinsella sp.]